MAIHQLFEEANHVESASDLASFIGRLTVHLKEEPDSWENPTLSRYLRAMNRWMATAATAPGRVGNEVPTWSEVASMLIASSTFFSGDDPL